MHGEQTVPVSTKQLRSRAAKIATRSAHAPAGPRPQIECMAIATASKKKSITPKGLWWEAFRSGEHTDNSGRKASYAESDIDTMATRINSQVSGNFVPPIVLGHPKTDSPRTGGVLEAKAMGASPRRLWLRIGEMTPAFAESVNAGEYKYVSPAFYPDMGLRHLGVLGGVNPSVKGMEPISAYGEGEYAESDKPFKADEIRQYAEPMRIISAIRSALMQISWRMSSIGSQFSRLRDQEIAKGGSVEDADKIYPDYLIQSLTGFDLSDLVDVMTEDDEAAPAFSEDPNSTGERASAGGSAPPVPGSPDGGLGGAPSALEAENLRLQEQVREHGFKDAERAFSERLDGMQNAHRLHPKQRPAAEKLFSKILRASEGAGALEYSEADERFAELHELLDAMPSQVHLFSEHTPPTQPNPQKNALVADAEARTNRERTTR